jgi:hypothetical protein
MKNFGPQDQTQKKKKREAKKDARSKKKTFNIFVKNFRKKSNH